MQSNATAIDASWGSFELWETASHERGLLTARMKGLD